MNRAVLYFYWLQPGTRVIKPVNSCQLSSTCRSRRCEFGETSEKSNSGKSGAPRVHRELLKLGFELSLATVAKYMVRHAADFFEIPTVFFDLLFVFVMLLRDRRRVVHFGVTAHPTAEWAASHVYFRGQRLEM
jgi:hypothetical protein